MSEGSRIAKNASWLVSAMSLNKLIAFGYFWAVAKMLGPQVTGTYFFSVSVTSIFVVLSDLGMTQVIILTHAGAKENADKILGSALRAKLALTPIAILASFGYALAKGADAVTLTAVGLACLVMAADTFSLMLYGALRGKQDLRPEALGMLIGQLLTATFGLTAAYLGFGAKGLVCGLLLGSSWNLVWAWRKSRQYGIRISVPSRQDVLQLAKIALPFAIAGLAVKTYSFLDTLFVEAFHGITAVGVYSVAYKMTYAPQFIPMTVIAALYPALAAAWARHEDEKIRKAFTGALRLMAFLGFAIASGFSAMAPKIIPIFYGSKFLGAIQPFEILPWVLLAIFMDFPIGALLNASNRAHLKTTAMVITMFLCIIMNVLLVPTYGGVGAAWANIVTFWGLFFMGAFFARNDAGGWRVVSWTLIRALAAAAICWFVWRELIYVLPFPLAFVTGSVVAVLVAFLFRIITTKDLRFIMNLRKNKLVEEEEVHANV